METRALGAEGVVAREVADAVLARIKRDDLIELALAIGSIPSPSGGEGAAGEAVYKWLVEHGFRARKVGMFPDRFNVMGVLPGKGHGYSLLYNAHMDSNPIGPRDLGPNGELAWRDGEELCGWGIVNDRGLLASFFIAGEAIKQEGVELLGDLLLTGVVGETGPEPVDEFEAPKYVSKDVGARFLATHGGVADYAIVAERTAFRAGWVEAGKAFFKITVYAQERISYTPYIRRPTEPGKESNAAVLAARLLLRLEEWAVEYERKHTYACPGGTVRPKVNVGAIRAGSPPAIVTPPFECRLYVDCRLAPNQDPLAVRQELRAVLAEMGIGADVELYLYRRGYEAQGIEPVVQSLSRAHRQIYGSELEIADSPFCSMWRDHNVFNEMGIPALTYGPGQSKGGGYIRMPIDELFTAAQVYALTALEVCSTPK